MDQAALAGLGNGAKKGRSRMGMTGLMGAVALCALIFWAGVSIRDHLAGYQPLRAIRTGNAIERRTAARDLTEPDRKINTEEAMAALIATLGDEDAGVRATAAESMGVVIYFSRDHPPAVPVASDLLTRRVEVATRVLVPLLSDRDPGVRAAAATGLGTIAKRPVDPLAPELTPEQLAALKHESNAVRRQSAKLIYSAADVKLPPELVAGLEDESAAVRAAAARALAHFGPDLGPEIPALFAILERDDTDVRRACAAALEAAWPNPALIPTLVELLKSRDRWSSAYAAKLLGRIGPEAKETIPALIAVMNERFDPAQRDRSDASLATLQSYWALRALGQIGPCPEGIAALVDLISPEKVEPALAYVQKLREHDKRAPALRKVGKAEPPMVDDPVVGAELSRITEAVQALGEIGPPAAAAVPALISLFNKSVEADWSLSQIALPAALGRIAPNSPAAPDAVAALIRVLDAQDYIIRSGAVEALGHFGRDAAAAIPKLQALQKDSEQLIRDAAAKTLAAIEAQSEPHAGVDRGQPKPSR
jgi:HEAT repeat protein